jgi:DTW domain-containing protein YfiP
MLPNSQTILGQNNMMTMATTTTVAKKRKRQVCSQCERPIPKTCICSALPYKPLELSKSRVVVLQHPHEQKRKNRSLPLIQLCFDLLHCNSNTNSLVKQAKGQVDKDDVSLEKDGKETQKCDYDKDDIACDSTTLIADIQQPHFHCIIARRLGDQVDAELMNIVNDPNCNIFLVFPSDDAVPLKEALQSLIQRQQKQTLKLTMNKINNGDNNNINEIAQHESDEKQMNEKVTLLFIDATWKYAKEMVQDGYKYKVWPKHIVQVKLNQDDITSDPDFQPRRFDIRTPPSLSHLSTAECIAHCLRIIEGNDGIFNVLMKPLDLMVQQWHSFFDGKQSRKK